MAIDDPAARKSAVTDDSTDTESIDTDAVLRYASELASPQGPLAGDETDVDRVRDLAAWLGDAASIPRGVDADLAVTDTGHPDDSHWRKHAPATTGHIESDGLVAAEHGTSSSRAEKSRASIEVLPARETDVVSVSIGFEAEMLGGVEVEHGGIAELTADQAEALAAALVEVADDAREAESDE